MFKVNLSKIKKLKNLPGLLIFLVFFLTAQFALGASKGKLAGTVTDKNGDIVAGVNIILEGTLLGAATDIDGNYYILKITPGSYSVSASMIGYKKVIKTNVIIQGGRTTKLYFVIEEAIIEGEEIVVTAERPVVEVDRTSTEFIINAEEIIQAPIVRSVEQYLKIMPGVSEDAQGDIVIRGSDDRDVVMEYDGIPLDEYRNFNLFAIEEVAVTTGGLGAEYGNAQGGLITVVTKEGRDKLTGTVEYGLTFPQQGHWGGNYWDDAYHLDGNGDTRLKWDDPEWVNEIDTLTGRKVHEKTEYTDIYSHTLRLDLSGPLVLDGLYFSLGAQSSHGPAGAMRTQEYSSPWFDGNWKITYRPTSSIVLHTGGFYTWNTGYLSSGGVSFTSEAIGIQPVAGLSRNMIIGGGGRHIDDRNIFIPLDYSGTGEYTNENYLLYLTMSHALSPSTFYDLRIYRQNTGRSNYALPDTIISSTRTDNSGWYYIEGGKSISYTDRNQTKLGLKFDLSSQVATNHLMRFGIDLQRYNIWETRNQHNLSSRSLSRIANNFNSGEGVTPTKLGIYLADKMEFDELVVNLGLRFDYFDFGSKFPVTPSLSNLQKIYNSFTRFRYLPDDLWFKPDPLMALAPRIGLAHPISEKATVHFYYGYTYQIPDFSRIYGDDWTATSATQPDKDINKNGVIDETELYNNLNSISASKHVGNPQVKYEKSINFEAGVDWNFYRDYILTSTLYYRSAEDQMRSDLNHTFWDPSKNSETRSTSQYTNSEYEDAKGFEFLLRKRYGRIFSLQASVAVSWVTDGRSGERYRVYVPDGTFIEKYYFTRYTGDTNGDGVVDENDSGAEVPVPMPDAQLEMLRDAANEHVDELRSSLGDELKKVEDVDGLYYYSTYYSTSGVPKENVERRVTLGLLFYLTLPENYGPQIFGAHIFENFNINLYYRLQDGLPYQYSSLDGNALWRSAPLSSTVDFRLEKNFFFSGIKSTLFLSVYNLFNNQEIDNNSRFTRNLNMNEYINYGLEGYSPISDAGSSFHGVTNGGIYLGRPRSLQLGLRVTF